MDFPSGGEDKRVLMIVMGLRWSSVVGFESSPYSGITIWDFQLANVVKRISSQWHSAAAVAKEGG